MRIWLMTVGEPLPLPGPPQRPWRTGLLAQELAKRGHEVVWWTSTIDHFAKRPHHVHPGPLRIAPNLELEFLEGRLYRRNVSLARYINHLELARAFRRRARQRPLPDVILCSLPPLELCVEAAQLGRTSGVPVLLDVRDLWPDELYARLPRVLRPAGRLLFWPMARAASRAATAATGLVAISRRYLEWGLSHARRGPGPFDAVHVLGYPRLSSDAGQSTAAGEGLRALGVDPGRKIFWFVGSLSGSIDCEAMGAAAQRLLATAPNVQLVVSGVGEYEDRLQALARSLPNLVLTGWVDQGGIGWLRSVAYAGLAPYRKGALMSITNKVFEYMAAGLPVVLGLEGEAKDLVLGTACGVAYPPGDAGALAEAIRSLGSDEHARASLGANGRQAFERDFAADVVYGRMADYLERVAVT